MKWKKIKLTDISKPKQWKNLPISELTSEGYAVYGANGIIGRYKEYNHESPTLAITCRGATCGTINITEPKSYITSNAMALDDISEDVDQKFLYYALTKRGFKDVITGAAQPQITREGLSKIVLDIPESKESQLHIATILSKAENLIAKRKESIRLVDEFLKSTFLEMFGDPVRNEKGWEIGSLKNYGSLKNGLNYTRNESGLNIRCLGVGDFKNLSKLTDIGSLPILSLSSAPSDEYYLQDGDLVFVRSNGNRELVGRCLVIFPKEEKVTYSGFCIRYRIDKPEINSIYLSHLFRVSVFRKSMLQNGRGANIQNINQQILEGLKIPVPPIELQTQFAQIVEKTEALKTQYQQSLQELENLYGSLSQKAFSGELSIKQPAV